MIISLDNQKRGVGKTRIGLILPHTIPFPKPRTFDIRPFREPDFWGKADFLR
jgi:hypothetical protein